MLFLITGGSGSGKSQLAEALICRIQTGTLYYLATMAVCDDESRRRVQRHRQMRAGKGFVTIETPHHLAEHSEKLTPGGTALLECMGNLVANEQFMVGRADPVAAILQGVRALTGRMTHVGIVTNLIELDGTPADAATYAYGRHMGQIGTALAKQADVVIEARCGLPIFWKGEAMYHAILDSCPSDRPVHV